jgi:hypothetical protein
MTIEVDTMLNPQNATITEVPPTATQFRLKYLRAGQPVAELVVVANYVTENQYVQGLNGLNALVPDNAEGADLVLTANAINVGGESTAVSCGTTVQVINPPTAPSSITVS